MFLKETRRHMKGQSIGMVEMQLVKVVKKKKSLLFLYPLPASSQEYWNLAIRAPVFTGKEAGL